jgi:hypothetical protein
MLCKQLFIAMAAAGWSMWRLDFPVKLTAERPTT